MTVARVATPREYVGLAADDMPTTDPDDGLAVPAGSRFIEVDTGLVYVFDGVETWGQLIYPTSL